MRLAAILRAILRKLTPPGNRASLDSTYRQPTAEGTNIPSAMGAAQHDHGVTR
ncbi:MAG TPA: hypothetical protein VE777_20505 [Gaiellales bacterium]|jgi:hypothetical protein|nr:hypothetical protein [Gaiellales bacterium]